MSYPYTLSDEHESKCSHTLVLRQKKEEQLVWECIYPGIKAFPGLGRFAYAFWQKFRHLLCQVTWPECRAPQSSLCAELRQLITQLHSQGLFGIQPLHFSEMLLWVQTFKETELGFRWWKNRELWCTAAPLGWSRTVHCADVQDAHARLSDLLGILQIKFISSVEEQPLE